MSNISFKFRHRVAEAADAEVVRELNRRAQVGIASIADLVNSTGSYVSAYPVLLDLLRRPFPIRIREMIVRALTVKDAHAVAFSTLVAMYRDGYNEDLNDIGYFPFRSALANAIAVLATRKDRHILKEFARNAKFGSSRSRFIEAIRVLRDPEVDAIVLAGLTDIDVRYQAIVAAGVRRLTAALPELEIARRDADSRMRRIAAKAIERINLAAES